MEPTSISFSVLYSMKCRNCKFPITSDPVHLLDDSTILCGRCCRKSSSRAFRNYCYETLASLYLYPCKNWPNHCPAKLHWNETLRHEKHCNYTGCCGFFFSHPGACMSGPREIPNDEYIPRVVPDKLLEDLKCKLCNGYLNCEPVYLNENLENICHRCIKSNGLPGPSAVRNTAYEHISQTFLFPCLYKSKGCNIFAPFGQGLWQHECDCIYGKMNSQREENDLVRKQLSKKLVESVTKRRYERMREQMAEDNDYDTEQSVSESDISTTLSHNNNNNNQHQHHQHHYHHQNENRSTPPIENNRPSSSNNSKPFFSSSYSASNPAFVDTESRKSSVMSFPLETASNDRYSLVTRTTNTDQRQQHFDYYDNITAGHFLPVPPRQRVMPQRSQSNRYDYESNNYNSNYLNSYYPPVHRHTIDNDLGNYPVNKGYWNPADYAGHFPIMIRGRLNNNNNNNTNSNAAMEYDYSNNRRIGGLVRTESTRETDMLINELRIKQDLKRLQKSLQDEQNELNYR